MSVCVCVWVWICECVLVGECVLVCEKCACVSFCVCCTGMWKLNGAFQFYCSSPRGWETGCHGYPGILPLMGGSLCSSGNLACLGWNTCVCFCAVCLYLCVCVCIPGGVVGWRQHSRTQEVTYVRTQASIPVCSCMYKHRLISCIRCTLQYIVDILHAFCKIRNETSMSADKSQWINSTVLLDIIVSSCVSSSSFQKSLIQMSNYKHGGYHYHTVMK